MTTKVLPVECYCNYSGFVRIYSFDPVTGKIDRVVEGPNLVMYSGADIMARLVAGDRSYTPAAIYFEYENLVDPGNVPVPPAYSRSDGIGYYNGLASPRDYLRVPITVTPTISSSDEDKYDGNQTTFFAITSGSEGVHGLPFSEANNSKVFGYAIAATPIPEDPQNDVIFSRTYKEGILKTTGRQIGIQWPLRFG